LVVATEVRAVVFVVGLDVDLGVDVFEVEVGFRVVVDDCKIVFDIAVSIG